MFASNQPEEFVWWCKNDARLSCPFQVWEHALLYVVCAPFRPRLGLAAPVFRRHVVWIGSGRHGVLMELPCPSGGITSASKWLGTIVDEISTVHRFSSGIWIIRRVRRPDGCAGDGAAEWPGGDADAEAEEFAYLLVVNVPFSMTEESVLSSLLMGDDVAFKFVWSDEYEEEYLSAFPFATKEIVTLIDDLAGNCETSSCGTRWVKYPSRIIPFHSAWSWEMLQKEKNGKNRTDQSEIKIVGISPINCL